LGDFASAQADEILVDRLVNILLIWPNVSATFETFFRLSLNTCIAGTRPILRDVVPPIA
jgi:hypothetical protein